MPSSSPSVAEDFIDTDYPTATWPRIGAQIAASIYGGRPHLSTFSQRIQQAILDLDDWLQWFLAPLRLAISQVPPNELMPIDTLYLFLNQVDRYWTYFHSAIKLTVCIALY